MGIMPDGKINPLCENGYLLGRLGKVRGCYRQYQEESQEKNQTMSVDVKIFGQSYLTCISQQAEFGKGHFKHK
ncbi:hypothetical protein AGMMS49949_03280 [Alphaproteobacteria bacterium]|nr:hypothetical protein AGMMS49949_03280 [Alphaproteobacteria bacterium]GHS96509.1 hypothetical protein AGMMS50296_2710 [Alphaproteobacteria bacterium]